MNRMKNRSWRAALWLSGLAVTIFLASSAMADGKTVLHTLNSGMVTLNSQQEADLNVTNLSSAEVTLNATILDAGGKAIATKKLTLSPGGSDDLVFALPEMSMATKIRGMISIEGSPKLLCDRFKPTLEIINPNQGSPAASIVISNFTHIDLPM